jgi:hypothetical protein
MQANNFIIINIYLLNYCKFYLYPNCILSLIIIEHLNIIRKISRTIPICFIVIYTTNQYGEKLCQKMDDQDEIFILNPRHIYNKPKIIHITLFPYKVIQNW